MFQEKYVEVVVDNPSINTDMLYTYVIPEELNNKVKIGHRILVPFGKGNRLLEGIVLDIKDSLDGSLKNVKLKHMQYILEEENVLSYEMILLAKWMREEYIAKYLEVLRTIIPTGLVSKSIKTIRVKKEFLDIDIPNELKAYFKKKKNISMNSFNKKFKDSYSKELNELYNKGYIVIEDKISQEVNKLYETYIEKNFDTSNKSEIIDTLNKNATKQREVINIIADKGVIEKSRLIKELQISSATLKSLKDRELILEYKVEKRRNPIEKEVETYSKIELNDEQRYVYNVISKSIREEDGQKFLIHGVTGSGKTEVYLQLIEKLLEGEKEAIVLVPEISLTPQLVNRFMGRFGDKVAVYHSKLSLGEKYDEWRRMRDGEVKIAIGTRSAIFAPFKNLGMIIIDEEHDQSYKSSMNPKYSTYEVANKRCEIEGAVLVLGSATPSIETYYRANKKEIIKLEMAKRANLQKMPDIDIIDMTKELNSGNTSIFSTALYDKIVDRLNKKEQVILFLNSRGHSKFVSCRNCGFVVECDDCDISMTYHREYNRMVCHYCGKTKKVYRECPKCGSKYIKYMGVGTQRVENEVKKYFPNARVLRMDLDTVSKKGSHEEKYKQMLEGEADILIGTQMISKGLDFPRVTLVGVVIADTILNIPNFKSTEVTYQLLTQVSGRAGRAEIEGDVVIQTYEPEHYSLLSTKSYDYEEFYNKEIAIREILNYPPFCRLIDLTIYGSDSIKTEKYALGVRRYIDKNMKNFIEENSVQTMGPNKALIYRTSNNYRWKVLLKSTDENMSRVREILRNMAVDFNKSGSKEVKLSIDIDPNSIV